MEKEHISQYVSAELKPSNEALRKLIDAGRTRLLCNPSLVCTSLIPFSDAGAIEDAIKREALCEDCREEYLACREVLRPLSTAPEQG
jgi:hypothetical protein